VRASRGPGQGGERERLLGHPPDSATKLGPTAGAGKTPTRSVEDLRKEIEDLPTSQAPEGKNWNNTMQNGTRTGARNNRQSDYEKSNAGSHQLRIRSGGEIGRAWGVCVASRKKATAKVGWA